MTCQDSTGDALAFTRYCSATLQVDVFVRHWLLPQSYTLQNRAHCNQPQLVETSGAADAASLAAALAAGGFALDLVVAVVDAEAGADFLRSQAVARSQVRLKIESAAYNWYAAAPGTDVFLCV